MSVVLPMIPADEAEIVLVPAVTPVASPAILTVATVGVEDDQLEEEVRFLVLPSL